MEHKRQFLICKKQLSYPRFKSLALNDNLFLYYHDDLSILVSHCKQNILIGSAFKSVSGTILDDLNNMTDNNCHMLTANWSGRWIILVGNNLYTDPGGMLGCYYSDLLEGAVISSSLALLNEQFLFEEEKDFKNIEYGNAMNWFPPPLTKLKGVRKLLVGQSLNIDELTIDNRPYLENKFVHLAPDELYITLAKRLAEIIKNVSAEYGDDVYLPLTGGFDSRTILAALLHNKASFSAFLFEHDNLSHADKSLPPILATKYDFSLQFIKRENAFDDNKYAEYVANSSGQAADAGVLFYSYGQYEPLEQSSSSQKKIILRGGVWEVGRKIYSTALINDSLSSEADIMENLKQCFPILKESKLHEQSIKLWIKHTQENRSNLSFKDRFYLEQRVSGWLSALEQASDLTGFDRIHPANCQDILDLLSLTTEHPQPKIMSYLQPDLLETPFNCKSLNELPKRFYNYISQKIKRWC